MIKKTTGKEMKIFEKVNSRLDSVPAITNHLKDLGFKITKMYDNVFVARLRHLKKIDALRAIEMSKNILVQIENKTLDFGFIFYIDGHIFGTTKTHIDTPAEK